MRINEKYILEKILIDTHVMFDNRKKSTDPIIAQKSGKFIMEYNRIFEKYNKKQAGLIRQRIIL